MTMASEALISQFYAPDRHPYNILEREAQRRFHTGCVLLDAGCGHRAPLLRKLAPAVGRAIGVDACPCDAVGVEYIRADLARTGLPPESVDIVVSRSVLEHLSAPIDVFREISRVLRPGGSFVFLTPNRWDYASVAATAVPNRLHPYLIRRLTGRKECDTFPTFYRANTSRAIHRLARLSGFEVESLRYLNQYPEYFRNMPLLFRLGVVYERLTSSSDWLRFLRGWILGTLIRGGADA
jgi:SAM-dependent methyltransferase